MELQPDDLGLPLTHTEVDYLIIADRADVVGGKLYLMGGSFNRIQPPQFPFRLILGIAVGVRVPVHESDAQHHLEVTISPIDEAPLVKLEGRIATGRPPGLRNIDVLVPMAFNLEVVFQKAGEYVLKAVVDGQRARRHHLIVAVKGT
jgi:hypothetical protein